MRGRIVARKSFHDQAIESHLLVGLIGRGPRGDRSGPTGQANCELGQPQPTCRGIGDPCYPCDREDHARVRAARDIVVSLYHLAMYGNSPQPPPMGSQPHLTIHSVRAGHQVLAPTKESRSEPAVVADGEPAFDSAAIPEPGPGWPYGAGWR